MGAQNARWKVGMGVYTPFGGLNRLGQQLAGQVRAGEPDLKAIFFQPTMLVIN
jgi:long-chain fatty acid transport protein